MSGCFLPIYGAGAITVLVASLPFKEMPIFVFVGGAIAATVLELITGIVMEGLFKIRYWDYSHRHFNFKGYICLASTTTWGFFSVVMVYGLHKVIEHVVFLFPDTLLRGVCFVLTIGFTVDFTSSFRTAMDLRELLVQTVKLKEEALKLKKRLEILSPFNLSPFNFEELQKKVKTIEILDTIQEAIEWTKNKLPIESLEPMKDEFIELKEKTMILKDRLFKQFSMKRINRMLRRNPSASAKSEDFQLILEEIKEAEKRCK
ncbi:membrane protein [Lachnospiraceae bacterium TWA4]|nr:membrane protein [Lachnospiraceae bacterium TWA4]